MSSVNHSERTHSTISPSGFEAYIPTKGGCYGFKPDNDSDEIHPVTAKGEELHEILEIEDLDEVKESEGYLQQDDDYDRRALDYCVDVVKNHMSLHGEPEEVLVEPRFEIMPLKNGETMGGFVDRVHLYSNWAAIFDWKFGWTPVTDASENWQGVLYSVGVCFERPEVEYVDVTFVQPRIGKVTSFTWTREDLMTLLLAGREVLSMIYAEDPETWTPNPINCSRCVRVTCPKRTELVNEIATRFVDERGKMMQIQNKFSTGKDTTFELPDLIDPNFFDKGEEIRKALDLCDLVEKWVEQTRKQALKVRVEKGVEIPGYSLVHRKPNTQVVDNGAAVAVLSELGFTQEDMVACSKFGITALKDKYVEIWEKQFDKFANKASLARKLESALELEGALNDRSTETPSLRRDKRKPKDFVTLKPVEIS